MKGPTTFRFGVGGDGHAYSTAWFLNFGRKDDIYLGPQNASKFAKISLHSTGRCHVGFDKNYWDTRPESKKTPRRPMLQIWQRRPTPLTGTVHVLTVAFPTAFLKGREIRGKPGKPLHLFECAPRGQAIEFGIFFSRQPPEILEQKFRARGDTPILYSRLDNGDVMILAGRYERFDPNYLPKPDKAAAPTFASPRLKNMAAGERIEGLTSQIYSKPNEHGTVYVAEIGGTAVQRHAAAQGEGIAI